jgi:hypothetical protein
MKEKTSAFNNGRQKKFPLVVITFFRMFIPTYRIFGYMRLYSGVFPNVLENYTSFKQNKINQNLPYPPTANPNKTNPAQMLRMVTGDEVLCEGFNGKPFYSLLRLSVVETGKN